MTIQSTYRMAFAAALVATAMFAAEAGAYCCGGGQTAYYPGAYTSYYSGAYTAYSPAAYQTYYSGWYPGYWMDRVRTRLWGSPTTYVAAYPGSYYASYAPTYAAYRPAYTVGYATAYAAPASCSSCSSCTASYAAPCTTCSSPCTTCARPCATCASPCSSCSSCAASTVSQVSYQQPAGCATCATGSAGQAPAMMAPSNLAPPVQQPSMPPASDPQPTLAPSEQVAPESTFEKPAGGGQPQIQPTPEGEADDNLFDTTDGGSSTYFQAPKLFDPNDRTAQRSIAPVTTAVYERPVAYRSVSARPISREQARQDAVGWTSLSE